MAESGKTPQNNSPGDDQLRRMEETAAAVARKADWLRKLDSANTLANIGGIIGALAFSGLASYSPTAASLGGWRLLCVAAFLFSIIATAATLFEKFYRPAEEAAKAAELSAQIEYQIATLRADSSQISEIQNRFVNLNSAAMRYKSTKWNVPAISVGLGLVAMALLPFWFGSFDKRQSPPAADDESNKAVAADANTPPATDGKVAQSVWTQPTTDPEYATTTPAPKTKVVRYKTMDGTIGRWEVFPAVCQGGPLNNFKYPLPFPPHELEANGVTRFWITYAEPHKILPPLPEQKNAAKKDDPAFQYVMMLDDEDHVESSGLQLYVLERDGQNQFTLRFEGTMAAPDRSAFVERKVDRKESDDPAITYQSAGGMRTLPAFRVPCVGGRADELKLPLTVPPAKLLKSGQGVIWVSTFSPLPISPRPLIDQRSPLVNDIATIELYSLERVGDSSFRLKFVGKANLTDYLAAQQRVVKVEKANAATP